MYINKASRYNSDEKSELLEVTTVLYNFQFELSEEGVLY